MDQNHPEKPGSIEPSDLLKDSQNKADRAKGMAGNKGNTSSGQQAGAEVFIGLVGAIGADLDSVASALADSLSEVNYTSSIIKISHLLHDFPKYRHLAKITEEEVRYKEHMNAGTEVRKLFECGEAMAQMAVTKIWRIRQEINSGRSASTSKLPIPRHAFIFSSLKHPSEVRFLRKLYGSSFFLLAAHTSREKRIDILSRKICKTHFKSDPHSFRAQAEALIETDESEDGEKLGQNVRETYPDADYFIIGDSRNSIYAGVARFVRLVFRHPFESPTVDELCMFHAKASAMRSADLSRQVGAVIAGKDGHLVATGCNEVPKAGGGLYWPNDISDHRDFQLGYDSNSRYKDETIVEILGRLRQAGWLAPDKQNIDVDQLYDVALNGGGRGILDGSRVTNVIEFGRIIHAEMAAITQAARFGASVSGTTLYCTTFPCHMCARHIIASGINRVVYIEPYPKSLARELYHDSIMVDPDEERSEYVNFVPFSGVAPRRFAHLFEKAKRKGSNGLAITWEKHNAAPAVDWLIPPYTFAEDDVILMFAAKAFKKNLDAAPNDIGGLQDEERTA